MELHIYEARKR